MPFFPNLRREHFIFERAKKPLRQASRPMIFSAQLPLKKIRGGTVLIASGDRDTFQLASDRTTILYPVRAGEMARIGSR